MRQNLLASNDLNNHFKQITNKLCVSKEETRSYINGIFNNYLTSINDLSKVSITLKYAQAKEKYNFVDFQTLGDWIFFIRSLFPESLVASETYYDTIAQCSYYRCYKMLDGQWKLFEELADQFPVFVNTIRQSDLQLKEDDLLTLLSPNVFYFSVR